MPTRREARERALSLCYEADVRGRDADELLGELPAPPDEYAEAVVRGVESHRDEVDAILRKVSEHWALERMPVIDRALLARDPLNFHPLANTRTTRIAAADLLRFLQAVGHAPLIVTAVQVDPAAIPVPGE